MFHIHLITIVYNDTNLIHFFLFTAKILLFYVIFYVALVGFFAAMLAVFWQTLDTKVPKWQLDGSIIGTNPGK